MRVRNAILTAVLAAAGLAVCADDAQAFGRKKKKAPPPAPCGGCGGAVVAAPAPCGGCGGGVVVAGTQVGSVDATGNVIVSGEAVPNPMPGTTANVTVIPATNAIPVGGTVYQGGTVIPAQYQGGYPGGVIQTGGYLTGPQTFQGGFQSGVVNSALGNPQYYGPGTTIGGAVGNYAGNAVGRGLFRRR